MRKKTCFSIGCQDISTEEVPWVRERLEQELTCAIHEGFTVFYTDVRPGVGMLFGNLVLEKKKKYWWKRITLAAAVLPHEPKPLPMGLLTACDNLGTQTRIPTSYCPHNCDLSLLGEMNRILVVYHAPTPLCPIFSWKCEKISFPEIRYFPIPANCIGQDNGSNLMRATALPPVTIKCLLPKTKKILYSIDNNPTKGERMGAMNEIIQAIHQRRSIRKYQDRQVEPEVLQEILEAASYSPNAGNRQSTQIVVCQNEEINSTLGRLNRDSFGGKVRAQNVSADQPSIADDPNLPSAFYGAPTVITLFAPTQFLYAGPDAWIMAQNIALAAASLGLGTCLVGRAQATFATPYGKERQAAWGIPEGMEAQVHITLGYPLEENPQPKPRRFPQPIFI